MRIKFYLFAAVFSFLNGHYVCADHFFAQPSITCRINNANDKDSDEESPSKSSTNAVQAHLGAGLFLSNGLEIGGKILYETSNTTFTSTSNTAGDSKSTDASSMMGYGPSLGFSDGGFSTSAAYIMSANRQGKSKNTNNTGVDTSSSNESDSKGVMADIGYGFPVGGYRIGPQLVYFNRTYKKYKSSRTTARGVTTESEREGTYTEATIHPYVGLWFKF